MVFGQSMPSKLALPLLSFERRYLILRIPISTGSIFLKTNYIAETGLYEYVRRGISIDQDSE